MASPSKQSKLPLDIQAFVRKAEEQLDSLLANSAAFRSDRPETVLFLTEVQQLVEVRKSHTNASMEPFLRAPVVRL